MSENQAVYEIENQVDLAELGVEVDKVEHIGFELDVLRKKGLLVDLNISGMGMFTRSASFEELGIVTGDEKTKRYTPGSKFLIPKADVDKLRSIETRMRQALDKYAWDVTGFRPYRWLPWTAYKQFKARWTELLAEFEDAKQDILNNHDYYMDMISQEFAAGAHQTWQAIKGQGYDSIIWNGHGYLSEREFTDAVVRIAQDMLPGTEKIQDELRADYRVGLVYGQADYAKDQAQAEVIYAEAQATKKEAAAKAALVQEQLNHEAFMHKLEKEKAELEIETMIQAEMDHARAQLENTRSPFEEVFTALRNQIAQDCQDMLESIKKNGFIRGKVAEKGRGLVELYDLLAVHDDKELRAKLIELRNAIGVVGDRDKDTPARNPEQVANIVSEIIQLSHENLKNVTEISRASFLEI